MSDRESPFDDELDRDFDGGLAGLRELWSQAQPSSGRGEDLEQEDALTQASVLRLREAWSALQAPGAPSLTELQRRRSAPTRTPRLSPRQVFALAAAALVLFAIALGLRSLARRPFAERSRLAADQIAKTTDAPSTGILDPHQAHPDIRVEVTDDERIVLQSGTVRLYLAMGTPPATAATPALNPLKTE